MSSFGSNENFYTVLMICKSLYLSGQSTDSSSVFLQVKTLVEIETPVVWEKIKNTFLTGQLWTTDSGFSLQLYQNRALPTVFRNPQMNTQYLETLTLWVPFRCIICFWQHKLSVYFIIGLHWLLPEVATRVEMFCIKNALKNFVNFIGKHLCCLESPFNKAVGLTPILKNICQWLLLNYTGTTHCYLSV